MMNNISQTNSTAVEHRVVVILTQIRLRRILQVSLFVATYKLKPIDKQLPQQVQVVWQPLMLNGGWLKMSFQSLVAIALPRNSYQIT